MGNPVRHSLSPAMHNAMFAHLGLDGVYVALEVDPEDASRIVELIEKAGFAGANLTVPFKTAAFEALAEVCPVSKAVGAVNTVVVGEAGLRGHNTDAEGFVRSFEEEIGPFEPGFEAIVIGTGGAGRAVAAGLASRGASRLTLLNRSAASAQIAAARVRAGWPGIRVKVRALDAAGFIAAAAADVVVNCTTGPADPIVNALPVEVLDRRAVWCDINYWNPRPPATNRCRQHGLAILGGLGMLIHQGAEAFRLFTGREADPLVMRHAAHAARERQGRLLGTETD